MKRLFALLCALLLGTCALAESMPWLEYEEDVLNDGSPVYVFQELSLKLPADWKGKLTVKSENGRISFYQTASYEKYLAEDINGGGFLFALGARKDGGFSVLPAFEYLGYSESSGMNYYLELPSDYPAYYEDAIRAEYDAMYARVGEVAANVSFQPLDEQSGSGTVGNAPAPQGDAQVAAISLERMRYHFEHSAMPRYFYQDPANMLAVLSEQSVYRLWTALADENGVQYPYHIGDFKEHWYDLEGGATVLQVEMPAPEVSPQCFRLYLIDDPNTDSAGYYTVEYENLLGDTAILCGWTKDGAHVEYGGAKILDPDDAGYSAALEAEAKQVAALAGVAWVPADDTSGKKTEPAPTDDTFEKKAKPAPSNGLVEIPCPELGFTTMADPAFSWDYKDGTGITIYTRKTGSIPYVIVWQSEDLIAEPFEYIREQYTPHIQRQYGDDLVFYKEYESYSLGGKELPAGVYTYRLQGRMVDLIRAYDSTGDRTVAFTAKYVQGEAEPTLSALHDAIRYFRAE